MSGAAALLGRLREAGCTVATRNGALLVRPRVPQDLRAELVNAKAEILDLLAPAADEPWTLDPTRTSVRVEYEQDGSPVGVWIVPDHFTAASFDCEPAIRRCDIAALLDVGAGALRRALVALRGLPGARVRSVGASQEIRP